MRILSRDETKRPEVVMIKQLVLVAAAAIVSTGAVADGVMDKYNKSCNVCHASGAAGAPKVGAPEWADRQAAAGGIDGLVASVTNGKGAMPPKGLCYDCSADDYKAMIQHLISGN
jgi:cytochrome c5